jgi:hypothetical protein
VVKCGDGVQGTVNDRKTATLIRYWPMAYLQSNNWGYISILQGDGMSYFCYICGTFSDGFFAHNIGLKSQKK